MPTYSMLNNKTKKPLQNTAQSLAQEVANKYKQAPQLSSLQPVGSNQQQNGLPQGARAMSAPPPTHTWDESGKDNGQNRGTSQQNNQQNAQSGAPAADTSRHRRPRGDNGFDDSTISNDSNNQNQQGSQQNQQGTQQGQQSGQQGNVPSYGNRVSQANMMASGALENPPGSIIKGTFIERQNADAAQVEAENQRRRELAIAAAKNDAKTQMEDKAKVNKQEEDEGIDYNGDGKIGYPGRAMTDEEAIKTATHNLLTGNVGDQKERQAMIDEMKVQEARDIQSLRARTGLGGMGLTGAAGGMESTVRQESARKQAITTADYDRQARQEALDRLLKGIDVKRSEEVYGAEMDAYEKYADTDYNNDGLIGGKEVGGKIGDGNPDNNEPPKEPSAKEKTEAKIPSNGKEIQRAAEQGPVTRKNNRDLYNYYSKLPYSVTAFPGDQMIDSFVDSKNNVYGVYKNSKGELYVSAPGGFGQVVAWDPSGGSQSKR